MDCQQAREQIDQRLQEQAAEQPNEQRDWLELDAHLAGCPKCSADWLELLRTRNLLTPLAREGPTPKEVESMWQAIQTAGPGAVQTIGRPTRRALYRYVAACAGIAAVLFIAFQLGTWQYGQGIDWPTPTDTMQGHVPTMAKVATGSVGPGDQAPTADAGRTLLGSEPASTREPPQKRPRAVAPPEGTSEVAGPALYDEHGRGTKAFWELVQRGEVDVNQYYCPSLDNVNANGLASEGRLGGYLQPVTSDLYSLLEHRPLVVGTEFIATPPPSAPSLSAAAADGRDITTYRMQYTDSEAIRQLLNAEKAQEIEDHRREQVRTAFLNSRHALLMAREKLAEAEAAGADPGTIALYRSQVRELEDPDRRVDPSRLAAPGHGQVDEGEPPTAQAQRKLPARPQAKIIKTGELAVEVTDYDAAVERIEAVVREHGGFVADGSTQEGTGGALVGRAVIRVLPERFESLFAALKAIGRVESENVKAADVTAEYVDLEARIASLRITEQRLQELVKSKSFIDKVSSLLEVEREMTRVRSQIEQLQGQLRVMADRVAMSTITVTFREPPRMVPSASMSVEVPILTDAADALAEALGRLNGRLTSGKTSKRDDGTLKGDYKLQISLARFGELLDAITDLGRVEERQILDWQFGHASAPWAQRTKCYVALVLFERSRPLPVGTVRVEVDALDAALDALTSVLADCDGSITSNKTTRQKDGSSVGELKLSVPAGRFAELTDKLASLGRTTAKQVAGEGGRIVGGAASVLCELSLTLAERPRQVPVGHMAIEVAQFEAARQALSDLVAHGNIQVLESSSNQRDDGTWVGGFRLGIKAGDMEDVVARLESLGRVQSRQISGLGLGDLSRIDPDALGTLGVALAEKATISPAPERAGGSIRDRLRDGLAGLYTSLGLILYGLVVMAPWLIIMLAGAWAIMWLRRKRQPVTKATSGS